jgi:hypothetical protein
VINQFKLILIINAAINSSDANSWRTSFINVNMCPSKHVPFTTWVKKHEATVAAADRFFTNQSNLFDAMPAIWQHLSEDDRHKVCALFDKFTGDYKSLLIDFVSLGVGAVDEIDKIRGWYFVTKDDPSIFVSPVLKIPPIRGATAGTQHQWLLDNDCKGFKFAPPNLFQLTLLTKFQTIRQRDIGVRCVTCVTIPTTVGVQKYLLIYLLQ